MGIDFFVFCDILQLSVNNPDIGGASLERIKTLNYYQKGIIIVMVAMILIFAMIYPKTISRVGYRYNDEILVPNQENGNIVYSGKIHRIKRKVYCVTAR